jgi:hypothetical protein
MMSASERRMTTTRTHRSRTAIPALALALALGLAVALTATACPGPSDSANAPDSGTSSGANAANAANATNAANAAKADAATTAPAPKSEPPPMREATRSDIERSLLLLENWVKKGATDPKNAWAMAHGIVAFGKDVKSTDGRKSIDAIVADYAEMQKKVKGGGGWTFPRETAAPELIPVQPHQNLMIKTFLVAGVPRDYAFKTKYKNKVTLEQLVREAEESFSFPTDDAGWRDYAWTAYALMLARSDAGKIKTSTGTIEMKELAEKTLARLELEQSFLEPLLGHPERVEKRKQGIYAHHCGGLHFVQAGVLAAAKTKDPEMIARARHQLDLVMFRWEAERRIYDETLRDQPKYKWLLLVQELKFFGHVLETFALARDYGVLPNDAELEKKIRLVAGDLVEVIAKLEPAYANQDAIGASVPQTKYDLIGDGCHAIRGLRRGLVAFFPPS